jgi:hypothetical protein
MKILLSLSFFLLCFFDSQAQFTKKVSLKPIQTQGDVVFGMKYRYGLKLLKDAYSIEVPLSDAGDVEIDRQYKGFKRLNTVANWIGAVPAFYFFYQVGNNTGGRRFFNPNEFLVVWGGSILASWGLRIAGRVKLKKAINSYNDIIFMPEVGQVNGLKAVYRF